MKKVLTFMLSLVMFLSLGMTAFAEYSDGGETTLQVGVPLTMYITDFELPEAGERPCDSNSVSVSEDCSIYDICWYHQMSDGKWESFDGDKFEEYETYYAMIQVALDQGTYVKDPIVYINGDDSYIDEDSFHYNTYRNVVSFDTIEFTTGRIVPDYVLSIPSDVTLTYGATYKQTVGKLTVSEISDKVLLLTCNPEYTNLINTADSADTIRMSLYGQVSDYTQPEFLIMHDGTHNVDLTVNGSTQTVGSPLYLTDTVPSYTLKALIPEWSGATPNAVYKSTITFKMYVGYKSK